MPVLLDLLKTELPKRALDALINATSFLIALWINSWNSNRKDEQTYYSMVTAIHAEARSNYEILADSYKQFFDNGIILRDFNLAVVSALVGNSLFVKHVSNEYLTVLNEYIRTLALANSYRRVSETLAFSQNKNRETWLEHVKDYWRPAKNQAQEEINSVLKMR